MESTKKVQIDYCSLSDIICWTTFRITYVKGAIIPSSAPDRSTFTTNIILLHRVHVKMIVTDTELAQLKPWIITKLEKMYANPAERIVVTVSLGSL